MQGLLVLILVIIFFPYLFGVFGLFSSVAYLLTRGFLDFLISNLFGISILVLAIVGLIYVAIVLKKRFNNEFEQLPSWIFVVIGNFFISLGWIMQEVLGFTAKAYPQYFGYTFFIMMLGLVGSLWTYWIAITKNTFGAVISIVLWFTYCLMFGSSIFLGCISLFLTAAPAAINFRQQWSKNSEPQKKSGLWNSKRRKIPNEDELNAAQREFEPTAGLYCYFCTKKLGLQGFEKAGKFYCRECFLRGDY